MEEHWVPEEGTGPALVQRLQLEGLAEPLRWLQNCLRRTARDREQDGLSFPVPLVPLSEENEDAMEDQRFCALLRKLGLRPPASEQESFWRIPATLNPQQLRRVAASIAPKEPPQRPGSSPPGLPAAPRPPQDLAPGAPLSHSLCSAVEPLPPTLGSDSESEEPLAIPVPSGSKRRRQLDSEDED
ncbi:TIM protein, partial [Penelope pileata]|nr:TIM protein [Penelope pileata]